MVIIATNGRIVSYFKDKCYCYINNIYEEEELNKISTCQNFRQVLLETIKTVLREIPFYNIDFRNKLK